jgi:MFS family permease
MELMWIVYAVENLTYTGQFSGWLTCVLFVGLLVGGFVCGPLLDMDVPRFVSFLKKLPYKSILALIVVTLVFSTILPTRETAIKMGAAYLIQQIATDDKTQALGNAAYAAAMRQLTLWSEEVPELTEMMTDMSNTEINKVTKKE